MVTCMIGSYYNDLIVIIKMVPNVGFEPTTYRLQIGCSTVELIRLFSGGKTLRCGCYTNLWRGDQGKK